MLLIRNNVCGRLDGKAYSGLFLIANAAASCMFIFGSEGDAAQSSLIQGMGQGPLSGNPRPALKPYLEVIMNVKSLLLGSAAAVAAATGAQAADPVVVVEPVAPNYVEVCDTFGAGFFYIPGTETCLDVGGYVRFQVDFAAGDAAPLSNGAWGAWTRGHLDITSKTDTELGVLTGNIQINAEADSNNGADYSFHDGNRVVLDQTYLALGGFQAGYFESYWDEGLVGEIDDLSGNTKFNSIRYGFVADGFIAGLSLDALTPGMVKTQDTYQKFTGWDESGNREYATTHYEPSINALGVSGRVGFAAGGVSAKLDGGYDTYNEEGALRLMTEFEVGPGTLDIGAQWASGWGAYANTGVAYFGTSSYSDWAVAAGYALNVSDKFTVTPAVQYTSVEDGTFAPGYSADDYWQFGALFEYEIVDGLAAKLNMDYYQADGLENDNLFGGWFRLERSF